MMHNWPQIKKKGGWDMPPTRFRKLFGDEYSPEHESEFR